MAADIGVTLFVELLGMTQYPGSPFTGNIYRDLIMFLIVPTVFIIMVIYTMTGRLIADNRFRIMIGVTAYLFIIASGFYPAFALLAGPYFVFLIFILGLLYFIGGHFRAGRGGGGGGGGGGFSHGHNDSYGGGGFSQGGGNKFKSSLTRMPKLIGRQPLEEEYLTILDALSYNKGKQNKGEDVRELMMEKTRLEIELFGKKQTNHDIKKRYGIDLDHH